MLDDDAIFRERVWNHYARHSRPMPWRETPSFYNILVSEIMLQQTQVERVMIKFAEFMEKFPRVEDLAQADLGDVLKVWQGLGYNRRAKYLHACAQKIMIDGAPNTVAELTALPGIGHGTAGAIMNYAYQIPTAYIETNIRTVYLHHYFNGQIDVSDVELIAHVKRTLPRDDTCREWFWALMDYGVYLKSVGHGRIDASRHYKKQAKLEGSIRQVRGQIIRALSNGALPESQLMQMIAADDRYLSARDGLVKDGLIHCKDGVLHL